MKGYLDVNFFPLLLAPVFVGAIIFGEESLTPDDLFNSLLQYLSGSDREVVNSALYDDQMTEEDREAFEDLLDREGFHAITEKEGVKETIKRLAHKCLLQNGNYARVSMSSVVGDHLSHLFHSMEAVREMYSVLKPTIKKVRNLLEASPQNKQETLALRYLEQYIRSRDDKGLASLLKS